MGLGLRVAASKGLRFGCLGFESMGFGEGLWEVRAGSLARFVGLGWIVIRFRR